MPSFPFCLLFLTLSARLRIGLLDLESPFQLVQDTRMLKLSNSFAPSADDWAPLRLCHWRTLEETVWILRCSPGCRHFQKTAITWLGTGACKSAGLQNPAVLCDPVFVGLGKMLDPLMSVKTRVALKLCAGGIDPDTTSRLTTATGSHEDALPWIGSSYIVPFWPTCS